MPGSQISLCSWHVDKDLNDRFTSSKEKVRNRNTTAWSYFDRDPELAFIRVDWLERHREQRIAIVERRIAQSEENGIVLAEEDLGANEPTLLNKDNNPVLRKLQREHLHWHPFKAGRNHEFPGLVLSSRAIWLWQSKQMHDLCCELGEGFAWEYLWSEWYRFDQWCRWARSADLEYFPVIQTNATVESHWSVLKYKGLKWFNRPRIDHLCATIHKQLIPIFAVGVDQVRMRLKPAGWYKCMITDWRALLHTVSLGE